MINMTAEMGNRSQSMGRFSVEFEIANYEDVVQAKKGQLDVDKIRRMRLKGVVDTGATRLVLPSTAVTSLGLPEKGQINVIFADGRRDQRPLVGSAQVTYQGRNGVFSAVVEP